MGREKARGDETMRWTLLLPVALPFLLGCQSGYVVSVRTSRDGDVLVFNDLNYDAVYAATASGVRRLADDGACALSPDGRWVLILQPPANSKWREDYRKGDRLTLVRLDTPERYATELPFDVPLYLLPDVSGR